MAIDTSAWDEIQLDPLSAPPEDFDGMTVAEAVELIEAWFLENFERPEQSTPRDDGDWVYIWGGPYDGDDIIRDVFSDVASDEIIDAAVEAINRHETEWVPNSRRIQPPDERENSEPSGHDDEIKTLYLEMQARLRAVEQAIDGLNTTVAFYA